MSVLHVAVRGYETDSANVAGAQRRGVVGHWVECDGHAFTGLWCARFSCSIAQVIIALEITHVLGRFETGGICRLAARLSATVRIFNRLTFPLHSNTTIL